MLPFSLVFVALGSFSRLFGTDWKERTSRDFARVTLTIDLFCCTDLTLTFKVGVQAFAL